LPWGSARQNAQGTQTSSSQARHPGAFEARGADGLRAASIAVPMLASKGNHINVTQPQSPVMRICFISGSKNEKPKLE
jgi:nitrous oxidase accessory protein NosD